jgi:hypothetical protein
MVGLIDVYMYFVMGQKITCSDTVGGEHSRKEPFEQLIKGYSEHLHMCLRWVYLLCLEAAAEYLHAQEGEYEDKEDEQDQQGVD